MRTLNSSVLILGLRNLPDLNVGADNFIDWKSQLDRLSQGSYQVVCGTVAEIKSSEFERLLTSLREKTPTIKVILIADEATELTDLQSLFEKYPVFRISDSSRTEELEKDIVFGLEEAQMAQQERELEILVQEQNEKLRILYQELEDRVRKRQNFLLETRRKTYIANARWESLREAMIAVYQATSIGDMEKNLLASLQPTLQLESIRILLKPQDQFFNQQSRAQASFSIFQTPLFKSQDQVGTIFFIRQAKLPFHREETDFLLRVTEAVSLALDRQTKLEESETLKEQWQATFNAVSDPVALINLRYELVQANSSFIRKSGLPADQIIGQTCYRLLFQRESPCSQCRLGKNFRLETGKGKIIYDVYSQPVPVDPLEPSVFVNLYHDVTEQIRMERKILESARLAEIGTIGSSIAHELNNPLGGILSFVQLIQMELKTDDPLYEDIVAMEEGVRRCKDIIQNLLGFTRDPLVDEETEVDLREVLNRAAKIVELQTKSRGIEVKLTLPENPAPFRGHFNLLSQAFRNLLHSSIDAILEKIQTQKGFHGLIEVRMDVGSKDYSFNVLDNGLGPDSAPSLGISIAGQIIHDYGGHLEFSSRGQPLRITRFTLPRPVFQA